MISHGSVLSPARCFWFVLRVRSRCFARPAASVSRSFLRRYGENSPWVASFTSFWRLESTSGARFQGECPLVFSYVPGGANGAFFALRFLLMLSKSCEFWLEKVQGKGKTAPPGSPSLIALPLKYIISKCCYSSVFKRFFRFNIQVTVKKWEVANVLWSGSIRALERFIQWDRVPGRQWPLFTALPYFGVWGSNWIMEFRSI